MRTRRGVDDGAGFNKVVQYWSEILYNSKLLGKTIAKADRSVKVDDKLLDSEIRKTLVRDLEHTNAAKEKLLIALDKTGDVIVDAVDYYLALPE